MRARRAVSGGRWVGGPLAYEARPPLAIQYGRSIPVNCLKNVSRDLFQRTLSIPTLLRTSASSYPVGTARHSPHRGGLQVFDNSDLATEVAGSSNRMCKPGRLSLTSIFSACKSATAATRLRPRPLPEVARAASSRKKRSNIRLWRSSGTPGPSSLTPSVDLPLPWLERTQIRAPQWV